MIDPPQPPSDRRMPGRPPNNRKKEEGEAGSNGHKLSRKGRKMTCQLCYQQGHNKQTCPQGKNTRTSTVTDTITFTEQVEVEQHSQSRATKLQVSNLFCAFFSYNRFFTQSYVCYFVNPVNWWQRKR